MTEPSPTPHARLVFSYRATGRLILALLAIGYVGNLILQGSRIHFDLTHLGFILTPTFPAFVAPAVGIILVVFYQARTVTLTAEGIERHSLLGHAGFIRYDRIGSYQLTKNALSLNVINSPQRLIAAYCYDKAAWKSFIAEFTRAYEQSKAVWK